MIGVQWGEPRGDHPGIDSMTVAASRPNTAAEIDAARRLIASMLTDDAQADVLRVLALDGAR